MGQPSFYRYVSAAERDFVQNNSMIRSISGVTYFAMDPPSRYDSSTDVVNFLAVPTGKEFRLGPIPGDEAPDWDIVPPRTVGPKQLPDGMWVAGGGTEAATSAVVWLFGSVKLV